MDRDIAIIILAFSVIFVSMGIMVSISLSSNYTIVGQVSDTYYSPQVFGTVTDITKVAFYGGESYFFKGDLRSQLEPSKVYTIKYHRILTISGTIDVVDSIEEGLHIN